MAERAAAVGPGTRVRVYWNLHKKCFSVQARDGVRRGRVIAHVPHLTLVDAHFVVNEAGRQKALREKRKNVHAFVDGTVAPTRLPASLGDRNWRRVSYNPYRYGYFFDVESTGFVHHALTVVAYSVDETSILRAFRPR